MIKDKITPEFKERLKYAIKKTIYTGEEQGFYICRDKEGKLFADKECGGNQCNITMGRPQDACKGHINQGDFHTHPYTSLQPYERLALINIYGSSRIKEDLKNVIIERFRQIHQNEGVENVSINTPSYVDTLKALSFKCDNLTMGTTCIGTDIEKEKVECWTASDKNINNKNCNKIKEELENSIKEGGDMPVKKWILPLLDKEIIDL
jgi:hypothetical protein